MTALTHQPGKRWLHVFTGLILILILALALFVRSYHLASIPGGLYPDEATNGIDALAANASGDYRLFYPNNYGREGLFINIQAFFVRFFGNSIPVLKTASVIFGTLFVWGMYLLGKELMRRRAAGLIAAFLAATSFWTINFSRIGFRAIMVPFLLSFTLYFFVKGLESRYWKHFLYSGLIFGLGVHTYVAFRVAPLIFVLILPFLFLAYRDFFRQYRKPALAFVVGAFITAAPMFWDFFQNPEHFSSRTGAVSIFSPEINHGDPWGLLAKTLGLSLVKYNFWGDQNWRHNYPPYPILDPVAGTLFLAGFLVLIVQTVRRVGSRLRSGEPEPALMQSGLILVTFFVMLMPEFLTEEGLPHALRAIGTQPPVLLLATFPAVWILDHARRSPPGTRFTLLSLLVIALFVSATFNLTKYFVFFGRSSVQMGAFNKNYTLMAQYLLSLPTETRKYVYANAGGTHIDNGLPVTAEPIVFLTAGKIENLTFIEPETTIRTGDSVIIPMRYDQALSERILEKFPHAREERVDLEPGTGSDFLVIHFPAQTTGDYH